MSPENKQRIIGIIVLIAFIALLIPFLFTSGIGGIKKKLSPVDEIPINTQKRELITQQIQNIDNPNNPNNPNTTITTTTTTIPAPDPVVLPQEQPELPQLPLAPENNQVEETAKAESAALEKPTAPDVVNTAINKISKISKISNKKIKNKEFWSVQIGSFSDQVRTKKLVAQLRNKGFHNVYTQKITTATESLTRVFVGREVSREKAEVIAKKLENTMKLRGRLVKNLARNNKK